mmetsp:Transcript_2997/g.7661  ORF Transcript_2997/g.7661 Transcript_2997/m.7661 type:complete len:251 (-) Transcript_2997:187-939(-)
MPCVLWGVACLSLPGPATVGEVISEFREALSVQRPSRSKDGSVSARSWSNGEACKTPPRVDLYRLVPIADQMDCRLTPEERVMAHLPEASFGCAEIEDLHRERDEAELRYDRLQEAFVTLAESVDSATSLALDGRHSAENADCTDEAMQMRQYLHTENKALRHKLHESELIRRELQETTDILRREFMLLAREVLPAYSSRATPAVDGATQARTRTAPAAAQQPRLQVQDSPQSRGEVSGATSPRAPRIRR